jgi:hypothetical protein
MAITTAKVTYSLKPETVLRIEELAVKWGVPKSEVVRRAVEGVNSYELERKKMTPLEALEELARNPIPHKVAMKWKADIRRWRRGWDGRGK